MARWTWEVIHLKEQLWLIRPHKPFSSCAGEQANQSLNRIIKSCSHIEGQSCLWTYTKTLILQRVFKLFLLKLTLLPSSPNTEQELLTCAAAKQNQLQMRSRSYHAFRTIQAQKVRKHSRGRVVWTWTFQDNSHWSLNCWALKIGLVPNRSQRWKTKQKTKNLVIYQLGTFCQIDYMTRWMSCLNSLGQSTAVF